MCQLRWGGVLDPKFSKTTAKKEWSSPIIYCLNVSYAAAFFVGSIERLRKERDTGGGLISLFGREEEKNLRKNGKCRGYRGFRGFAKVFAVLCVQCTTYCHATLIFIPLYSSTNTSFLNDHFARPYSYKA